MENDEYDFNEFFEKNDLDPFGEFYPEESDIEVTEDGIVTVSGETYDPPPHLIQQAIEQTPPNSSPAPKLKQLLIKHLEEQLPQTREEIINQEPNSIFYEDGHQFWKDVIAFKSFMKECQHRPLRQLEGWLVIPANKAQYIRNTAHAKGPVSVVYVPEEALSAFRAHFPK